MKRLLLTTTLICSLLMLVSVSVEAQSTMPQSTYQWGKPQAVQTPIVLGPQAPVVVTPFPDIKPTRTLQRRTMRPMPHPASLPLPRLKKVTWPVCETWTPAPPMPIYVSPSLPIYAVVDAKLLWQKAGISFHTDQLSLVGTNPLGEFGISLIDPKAFKIRYSVTMQQVQTETITPTTAVMIGAAQVVAAQGAIGQAAPIAGAAAAGTPIKVDWTVGPNHRLDLVCLGISPVPRNFWLSPAFVANWMDFKITGTTTNPGTATTGTETFQNFYWGGGVEAVYAQNNSRLSALVAASDKYLMADTALAVAVGSNFDLTLGWQGKQIKMERDTTVRLTAPTLGLAVRF